jgi:short-subunit dehydrogenase
VKNTLSTYGVEIRIIPRDLFDIDAAQELYAMTNALDLEVEVLINDAGQGQYGKFAEEDLQRHLNIIQLNIASLVSLTHLYLNDMIRAGKGMILQVGSEVSKIPGPLFAVYAATKAFVASFTEALINELDGTGVTMTLLMPGGTDTDFFDKAQMEDTKVYREGNLDSPAEVAELAYEAMKKGDRRIIGPAGKKNVVMAAVTPDNLLAKNLRSKMEPSDKDPEETRQEPEHERSRAVREKSKHE